MATPLPLSTPEIPTPGDLAFIDNFAIPITNAIVAGQMASVRAMGTYTIFPEDAQAEFLVFHSRFPFQIERIACQCFPLGTATLNFKINSTNVGGLSAVAATAVKVTADATSADMVAINDAVTVTPNAISSDVERIVITLWGDMTALPQEVL